MSAITVFIIAALLYSSASGFVIDDESGPGSGFLCPINPKVDCGWIGIDQELCEENGCCWEESETGAPWCYYQDSVCPIAEKEDCGHVGTTQEECEGGGCCWEEVDVEGEPWCFYGIRYCDTIRLKPDCGMLGTTPEACVKDGCCWVPSETAELGKHNTIGAISNDGAPWCFYQNGICPETDKVDCGYIPEEACEAKGCCWEPSDIPGEPWCFKPVPGYTGSGEVPNEDLTPEYGL